MRKLLTKKLSASEDLISIHSIKRGLIGKMETNENIQKNLLHFKFLTHEKHKIEKKKLRGV